MKYCLEDGGCDSKALRSVKKVQAKLKTSTIGQRFVKAVPPEVRSSPNKKLELTLI